MIYEPTAEIAPYCGLFVKDITLYAGCNGLWSRPTVETMSLPPTEARLIREHIAKTRKNQKISGAELSEAINKAQKYISRVETGEIETPPLETLAEIAEKLDSPLSYMFFTDGFGESAEELRKKIQHLIATDDLELLRRYYRLLLVAREKL